MYENEEKSIQEIKFNYFLNKTIIGASKKYYEKKQRIVLRELLIIDDANYEVSLKDKIKVEDTLYEQEDISVFNEMLDSENVLNAVKSLTDIERLAIFLLVIQEYSITEVAEMLGIYFKSVSRIKIRALKKLRDYLERN